jgi:hypothetical protein
MHSSHDHTQLLTDVALESAARRARSDPGDLGGEGQGRSRTDPGRTRGLFKRTPSGTGVTTDVRFAHTM